MHNGRSGLRAEHHHDRPSAPRRHPPFPVPVRCLPGTGPALTRALGAQALRRWLPACSAAHRCAGSPVATPAGRADRSLDPRPLLVCGPRRRPPHPLREQPQLSCRAIWGRTFTCGSRILHDRLGSHTPEGIKPVRIRKASPSGEPMALSGDCRPRSPWSAKPNGGPSWPLTTTYRSGIAYRSSCPSRTGVACRSDAAGWSRTAGLEVDPACTTS